MSDPSLAGFAPENTDNVLARMRQAMVPQAPLAPEAPTNYLAPGQQGPGVYQQGPPLPPVAGARTPVAAAPQMTPHPNTNWHDHIAHAHAATGVPVSILDSVIMHESSGNPNAISPVGAIGLMQLMPGTARDLKVDPHDPAQNVLGGARYLQQMYHMFGSWPKALAAYNAGPGAVQKYGGIPPYKETQNYVTNIQADINKRYGGIK